MKASPSIVPKVQLPGDAGVWTAAIDFERCEVVTVPRTKDQPPKVTLMAPPNANILVHVSAEKLRDGLHVFMTPTPDRKSSPLHLALRNRAMKESKMSVTAAVLTGFAYHSAKHKPAVSMASHDWMKKVHGQMLRELESKGLQALSQVTPGGLNFLRECMRLVDRAMNRDVDDALSRVKTEFQLLSDHVEEDDILRIWREIIVEKTHSR